MADLKSSMPALKLSKSELKKWGQYWLASVDPETKAAKPARAFNKRQGIGFAGFMDKAFAESLAAFLGGIDVVDGGGTLLRPGKKDCVELGPVRVIGGIRPQNFDAAYRPDGPRVVFDSKTLNDRKSVSKNWQNMVNDLATEAATVHTRYPYAIVAFLVVLPRPALGVKQTADIVRTLERMGTRKDVLDQHHLAESIGLVVWDPDTGAIDTTLPGPASNLRVETFCDRVYPHYISRYKGLPPHD